ncbi:MAG: alkaline phosphatase [Aggregatilineales bacterium]
MNKLRFIVVSMLFVFAISSFGVVAQETAPARSVILLISDGASGNHFHLAELYAEQILGIQTATNTMPFVAYTRTLTVNDNITDSAPAGSSIHAGGRYRNGVINIDEDLMTRFTIAHAAQQAGKSVGIVSTARITHATPASAYASVPQRDMEDEIAVQLLEFLPEVALGGGRRHFLPSDGGGRRGDGRDLVTEFVDAGYTYVANGMELNAIDLAETDRLLGLFTGSHMAYEIDRVQQELNEPSLAEMTLTALEILGRNENGFFLSVEGARIDHASHGNDPIGVLHDQLAFEEAVRVALDYQAANPDTLVIVTADHDCGGLVLGRDNIFSVNIPHLAQYTCSIEYTLSRIGADPENYEQILADCGWQFTEEELAMLEMFPLDTQAGETGLAEFDRAAFYVTNWLHFVMAHSVNHGAQIGWTSWTHTANPVFTFAAGPGAERLTGNIHLEDIAFAMADAMGVTFPDPVPCNCELPVVDY